MSKTRKQYTPTEKVAILKRHLVDDVPVSDLCDEYGLHPTLLYNWQNRLMGTWLLSTECGMPTFSTRCSISIQNSS